MRAFQRAPGGAVALAARGQRLPRYALLDFDGGRLADLASSVPGERDVGLRKRPVPGSLSIMAASSRTISARAAAIATPVSAICASIAVEPGAVARALRKQAVAAAHRLLIVQRALAVARDRSPAPAGRESAGGRWPAR